jgi:hypothetical protein
MHNTLAITAVLAMLAVPANAQRVGHGGRPVVSSGGGGHLGRHPHGGGYRGDYGRRGVVLVSPSVSVTTSITVGEMGGPIIGPSQGGGGITRVTSSIDCKRSGACSLGHIESVRQGLEQPAGSAAHYRAALCGVLPTSQQRVCMDRR